MEKQKGKIIAHFRIFGCKTLKFRVLRLHTIFGVFSDKIFFCSEFSSFEAVTWGFLEEICQKISKKMPPPDLPPLGEEKGTYPYPLPKGRELLHQTVLPLEKGELEGDENPLNPKILRK